MILYSNTFSVDKLIHNEWFSWMKNVYIPTLKLSGLIKECRMYRLIDKEQNEDMGITYSFQFTLLNESDYDFLIQKVVPKADILLNQVYSQKYVSFTTVLEILE
jgi:hypothetical protein